MTVRSLSTGEKYKEISIGVSELLLQSEPSEVNVLQVVCVTFYELLNVSFLLYVNNYY